MTARRIVGGHGEAHGHFILKCTCGRVIAQCRCLDPSKRIEVSLTPCDVCKPTA